MARSNLEADRPVHSVSEITRHIKLALEGSFYNLWVVGEISNFKKHSSGHLYFTLKDAKSQLPGVMFASSARRLRFKPGDGMAVVVWGHVTVYEPRGAYQIRVERMEPRGKGALQLAFEQLKEKLSKEGLFDQTRKRALPLLPKRVAVVTSPTGAAVRDLCRILHNRFPNLEVVVYPAQVQGDMAAAEIAKGIQVLNRLGSFDVLIVTRGGGSLEDLWPFNEESVARAIAASTIPVVSAVGHEVDFTISDFVADVRAATPSAAAEIVVKRKEAVQEQLLALAMRMTRSMASRLQALAARVERTAAHQAFAAARHGIEMRGQRVDEASYRARSRMDRLIAERRRHLDHFHRRLETQRLDRQIGEARSKLTDLGGRLLAAELARRERARQAFGQVAAKLEALSPLAVLGRGYSLTWSPRGKLLRQARDVEAGDAVRVELHEGQLHCRVESVIESSETPERMNRPSRTDEQS